MIVLWKFKELAAQKYMKKHATEVGQAVSNKDSILLLGIL